MENMVLLGAFNLVPVLVTCVIGAVCGYLAGQLMKGGSMGLVPNIVIGVVGSFLFGSVASILPLPYIPWVTEIIAGTVGAVILLFLISLFNKAKAAV